MAKINLDEFNKAEKILKERSIPYIREDQDEPGLFMGAFERHMIEGVDDNGDWLWDFVCSTGTYGSKDGLLEYWSKKARDAGLDPSGWLTAEEVVQKIEAGE